MQHQMNNSRAKHARNSFAESIHSDKGPATRFVVLAENRIPGMPICISLLELHATRASFHAPHLAA